MIGEITLNAVSNMIHWYIQPIFYLHINKYTHTNKDHTQYDVTNKMQLYLCLHNIYRYLYKFVILIVLFLFKVVLVFCLEFFLFLFLD